MLRCCSSCWKLCCCNLKSCDMSVEQPRAFKNPFPDYQVSDRSTILAPDGVSLHPEWQASIKDCIKRLMGRLEEAVLHEIDHSDNSVYTGTTGIALLFLLANQKKLTGSEEYLQKSKDLVEAALGRLKRRKVSFLGGDAGPLATGAVVYHLSGHSGESQDCVKRLLKRLPEVKNLAARSDMPDELLYGRSGYLYSLLFVRKVLGTEAATEGAIEETVNIIIESGIALARKVRTPSPLMYEWHESYYLGAAHGISGIMFELMRTPGFSENEDQRNLVEGCIDYLVTLRFPSGNYPSSLRSRENDKLLHWCHGAPGFIHMFIQAYKIYGKETYREEAMGCGDVIWSRGLLQKGYGLCHGVAGNGYAFLALFNLTKDLKHLYRALKFAEWIFDYGKHGCRSADRPYSLFEGMAGTIYYLVDLLDPYSAEFPAFY